MKRNGLRLLSALLALVMVLVLLPVTAQADGEIEISNYEQLKAFAARVNARETGLNAKLTADITCTDKTWTPIGNEHYRYGGTFDGQGYKIIGLSNADVDYSGLSDHFVYIGLFGRSGGTVENVVLEDCDLSFASDADGHVYMGAVVGRNDGTVKACSVSGKLSAALTSSSGAAGIGGVVGYNKNTVKTCTNSGAVSVSGNIPSIYVGGVVGDSEGAEQYCANTGAVSGAGNVMVGGVVGYCNSVKNCFNTGAVSGDDGPTGGIVGFTTYGTVENCLNVGTVTGDSHTGGVIGQNNYGTVKTCLSVGAVSGSGRYIGGVVGMCPNNASVKSYVENCYCLDTSASAAIGDVGTAVVTSVSGLTAEQLKSIENCAGFSTEGGWYEGLYYPVQTYFAAAIHLYANSNEDLVIASYLPAFVPTKIANPFTYADHDFTGWNTDPDGNGDPYSEDDAFTLQPGEALTLHAQWRDSVVNYPLKVGGEQVTDLNKGDIFGDGTAKFEIIDGRNVLTLNGYKLENYIGVGIYADGIDLTIVGSAEIGVTGATAPVIAVNGNLTLNGDFTLRADRQTGAALVVVGNLTVEGGALDVENTYEGNGAISIPGTMTVNGGTVHAKANGTNAIYARIILNNGEQYLLGNAYASEVKIGVPVEHTVTVVDGTADKTSAKAGDTVTITADDAEYGYAFLQWEMLEDVEFARGDALTTTFTMPDHDVTVTPVYKEILISDIDDQTYTGEEITLTFGRNDLTLDGVDVALINGTDYSLTYANNVNAGTATVTVTFHDRETKEPDVRMGTKSKTFTIRPASIAAAEIAEIVDQTYQGKALTPEPTVTWNGRVLEKDTDYTLQYFNNVNVGTNPYVTVTGKGNFDENTDVGLSFTIIPAELTITAIDQEYTYNGYPQGEGGTVYATPAEIAQKVTVEGLQGDDKLTSVILDGDATEPDTYPGRIQPSDAVIGNTTGTVTGNYEITYVPGTLTIKPCYYTITFVNEDGTELQSGEVLLGKTPAYTGKEPTKPATAQYTYTFAGWKDENGTEYGLTDDLPAANGDMTYTAIYTSTVNEYTITFVNEDGTELQSGKVPYGMTPAYTGEDPTKPATAQYTYIFAGWTPEVVPVAGDATYTATYTSTLNKYTIEFNAEDVQFKGATPYVIANGSAQEPRVVVKNAEGEIVPEDSYDVAYRENTAPGTGFAYVTFNDGSDYTLRAVFKIYIRSTEEMTVENTAEGIRLSWAPVEGAAGYIVYRRAWNNTRGSAWTTFERWFNTTETTWTDGSDADHKVYAGTRYQYGVKAYFEPHADAVTGQTIGGAFDNYNLGTVGPLVTTVRITTRTLKSVTPGTKRMTVKWEGSKYFTGYQIQYATDESFASGVKYTWVKDAATYETWIGNLTSGGTYWVRVRSYHEFEGMTYYGGWSNALSCTVK